MPLLFCVIREIDHLSYSDKDFDDNEPAIFRGLLYTLRLLSIHNIKQVPQMSYLFLRPNLFSSSTNYLSCHHNINTPFVNIDFFPPWFFFFSVNPFPFYLICLYNVSFTMYRKEATICSKAPVNPVFHLIDTKILIYIVYFDSNISLFTQQ